MNINLPVRACLSIGVVLIAAGAVGGWFVSKRFAEADASATVGATQPSSRFPLARQSSDGSRSAVQIREGLLFDVRDIFQGRALLPHGPRIPGPDEQPSEADAVWGNARVVVGQGKEKRAEAIAAITKAIELDRNEHAGYVVRAWLHASNENFDNAIADYTEAIRCGAPQCLLDRAAVHMRKGEFDKAVEDCTRAINWLPRDNGQQAAYSYRAIAYAMRGEFRSCEDDLKRLDEIEAERRVK